MRTFQNRQVERNAEQSRLQVLPSVILHRKLPQPEFRRRHDKRKVIDLYSQVRHKKFSIERLDTQPRTLGKGKTLEINRVIVIFNSRKQYVGLYVIDPQMVEVESPSRFPFGVNDIIRHRTLAYDYVIDAQVVECRVIVILRRVQSVDNRLYVKRSA